MTVVQAIIEYFAAHPAQLGGVILALILAIVGLWYVLAHHLEVIMITLMCAGGVGSGAVVLWRGASNDLRDLMVIGAFLLVVFPVIFMKSVRLGKDERDRSIDPKLADKPLLRQAMGLGVGKGRRA